MHGHHLFDQVEVQANNKVSIECRSERLRTNWIIRELVYIIRITTETAQQHRQYMFYATVNHVRVYVQVAL